MAVLTGLIDDDAPRAGIVIAGGAGVDKTRLAREAGAAAVKRGW